MINVSCCILTTILKFRFNRTLFKKYALIKKNLFDSPCTQVIVHHSVDQKFQNPQVGAAAPGIPDIPDQRGYIYGAIKGHHDAMFTAAIESLDGANLILTLKLTLFPSPIR